MADVIDDRETSAVYGIMKLVRNERGGTGLQVRLSQGRWRRMMIKSVKHADLLRA